MLKRCLGIFIVLGLTLSIVFPAAAITYGEPDDGRHPYVGLIGFYDTNGDWLWRCSGTLISEYVILTAAHCTSPDPVDGTPASARVWFDEVIYYDPIKDEYTNEVYYDGIPIPNPEFTGLTIPETHDIGAVILNEPMEDITAYGQLPTLGYLDELAQKGDKRKTFVYPVGYGVNDMKPEVISLRTRYIAQSFVISLKNAITDGWNLMSSNNPGLWAEGVETGGTCFGDSGGPVFINGSESNLIVGITSFGFSANCTGADFSYRVDIQDSRDFLSQFEDLGVVLP